MVTHVGTTLTHYKNMIANIVTISTYCPQYQAFEERQIWLNRRYRLTYRGAQRIITKTHPSSIVTRIQTVIYA